MAWVSTTLQTGKSIFSTAVTCVKVYFAKNAFEYLDEDTDYTVNCGEVKTVMESVLNKDNVIFLSHYIVIDDVFETLKDVKN